MGLHDVEGMTGGKQGIRGASEEGGSEKEAGSELGLWV